MTDQHGPERAPRKIKPAEQATQEARRLLGRLLEQRRGQLGFTYRSDMEKATGLHWRMITDLENATRANFSEAMLGKAATAYQVTSDSVLAVLRGEAGRLETLDAATPAPSLPPPVTQDFPWTPDGRFLSAAELADAAPEATVFLAAVGRAQELGLNPDDLDGAELFPDDPRRALAWDTVSQWPWQYGIWMAARGLRKAQAARSRQPGHRGSGT